MRIVCTNSCITDEICDNNIDDDGDGLFDCLDPDCGCTPGPCTPKQAETWYFGDHSGLDFSTEPPSVLSQGKTENNAACAVANDVRGHLLFYSDGKTVFNRFHQPMPDGSGLASGNSPYRSESVIIPHPGDPGLFYLFTVSPGALGPDYAVARYSLVNMRLDGGRGDVVAGLKDVPLLAPGELVETRLAAVKACSAACFWLAIRPQPPMSSGILTFRIDSLGLHPAAVFSAFNWPPAGGINQMKFSPDGRRLAVLPITSDAIILFDFDASPSGKCTNPQTIYVAPADGLKGLEFSAGGRFLYVSKRIGFAPPGKSSAVVQYDLEAGDAAAIQASATVVGQHQIALAGHEHWGMQLASNGKIYVSAGFLSGTDQYNPFLHVIHQPDRAGIKCQFEEMGLSLSPAAGANRGLCNFPSSYFNRAYVAFSPLAADTVCVSDSLYPYTLLQAGCMQVDSFQWKLEGLSASFHADSSTARVKYLAQGEGLLTIQAFTPCGVLTDTLPIVVTSSQAPPLDLGADRFLCVNDTATLKAPGGFKRYRWQDGSAGPEFAATKAGLYWVEAWDICGAKQTDTIVLTAVPAAVLDLGPDRIQCPAAAVSFTRPAGFVNWRWTPGNSLSCDTCAHVLAAPQASLTYIVVAQTAEGCSFADTLLFTVNDTLFFQLDTNVCSDKRLELFGASLPADTSAQILIAAAGPGECDTLWMVHVLGVDTESSAPTFTICPGAFLQFNGFLLPADTVATFIFRGSNGCDSLVTVTTVASPAVTVELPADTVLRLGDTLALASTVSGFGPFFYNWSPGNGLSCPDCPNLLAAPVFTTLFTLQVNDSNGCSGSDSILVTVDQRCILYAVTAFTPNGDGANDWFFPKTDPCVRQVLSWRIFNRWGQVVFERKNFAPNMEMQGWDGRVEGKDAASDVYIWLAELEYYNGDVVQKKGQITLLR